MFFFFNDTATTEIYTLSLHDALPISSRSRLTRAGMSAWRAGPSKVWAALMATTATYTCHACRRPLKVSKDRKSTRLNSSHANISYAVFCLKKKKTSQHHIPQLQPPPC